MMRTVARTLHGSGKVRSSPLRKVKLCATTAAAILLGGCGANLYSLPFYTSADLHNTEALAFLKQGGPSQPGAPGSGLTVKNPIQDGQYVMLTASGGGMRASAFTLGVLAELDELVLTDNESAFEKIDLVSSVSGGSWAWAAVLADRATAPNERLALRMDEIERRYALLQNAQVRTWTGHLISTIAQGKNFGDVYSAAAAKPLPFVYFNASLYPSQSPFVFTPAYLTHYKVRTLGDPASEERITPRNGELASIPIGYAAGASGAVPGYTSAFGETDLCNSAQASFCFSNRKGGVLSHIQLMDGGVYDNIGYKTALEVALRRSGAEAGLPGTLISIDSSDAEAFQTVSEKERTGSHMIKLAMAASFPNQNSTFDRLAASAFDKAGITNRVLLNFNAAANFDADKHGPELRDLPDLAHAAAFDVSCYDANGRVIKGSRRLSGPAKPLPVQRSLEALRAKSPDCLAMNFARVGFLHKTTFKYDPYAFRLRYQLGRLVVRMHADDIARALRGGLRARR